MGSIAQFYIKRSNRIINKGLKQYDVQGIVRKIEKSNERRINMIRAAVKAVIENEEIMTRMFAMIAGVVATRGMSDDDIVIAAMYAVMTVASVSEDDADFYMSQKTLDPAETAALVASVRTLAGELTKKENKHA